MSVKLTHAQLAMLSAAAQRADLCLTAPNKLKGAILAKVSDKLMKFGLVREVRAKADAPVWRRDNAGHSYALKLTTAGLKAIAVDDRLSEAIAPREAPQPQSDPDATKASGPDIVDEHAKTPTPRAGGKLAWAIGLMQRSDGATISNLTEATGWLPHTVRAALTGLRKRGYAVVRERVDTKDSVYRISSRSTDDKGRFVLQTEASESYNRELKRRRSARRDRGGPQASRVQAS
jgi:hypothetical protein